MYRVSNKGSKAFLHVFNILAILYGHCRLWNTMTCKMVLRPRFWPSWREGFRLCPKRGNTVCFKSGALSQRHTDNYKRGENSLTGKKQKQKTEPKQFDDPKFNMVPTERRPVPHRHQTSGKCLLKCKILLFKVYKCSVYIYILKEKSVFAISK